MADVSFICTIMLALLQQVLASGQLRELCNGKAELPLYYRVFCDYLQQSENYNDVEQEPEVDPWYKIPSEKDEGRFGRDTSTLRLVNNAPASHASSYTSGPGIFYGMRVRRGGNYIRFGRSTESNQPFYRYISSFGGRNTRGDGHYVRFGRAVPTKRTPTLDIDIGVEPDDAAGYPDVFGFNKKFMRFGKRGWKSNKNSFGKDKKFMRFGKRDHQLGNYMDKKFMRFGRRNDDSSGNPFMRFGKADGNQFMRFGKRPGNEDAGFAGEHDRLYAQRMSLQNALELDDPELSIPEINIPESDDHIESYSKYVPLEDKRDMGSDPDPDVYNNENGEKRFMRFGRAGNNDDPSESGEKRFMRFGKRANMKPLDIEDIDPNKRFMRFGKRNQNGYDQIESKTHRGKRSIREDGQNNSETDTSHADKGSNFKGTNESVDEIMGTINGLDAIDKVTKSSDTEKRSKSGYEKKLNRMFPKTKKFMRFGKRGFELNQENMEGLEMAKLTIEDLENHFSKVMKRQDEILEPIHIPSRWNKLI